MLRYDTRWENLSDLVVLLMWPSGLTSLFLNQNYEPLSSSKEPPNWNLSNMIEINARRMKHLALMDVPYNKKTSIKHKKRI